METIASRKNPLVLLARRVADGDPQERGRMLLDGLHLVQEARAAGMAIQTAAFSTRALSAPDGEPRRVATSLANIGCRVVQVSDAVMDAMSPVSTPTGIVAIAARPKHDLADILGSAATTDLEAADIPSAAVTKRNRDSQAARPLYESGLHSQTGSHTELGPQSRADSHSEAGLQSRTSSHSEVSSQSRAGSDSEAGLQSRAGSHSEVSSQSQADSHSEAGRQSRTSSHSEVGSQSRADSHSEVGLQSRAGSDSKMGSPSRAGLRSRADGPLIVVVVDVQDPGNLGAIVRVAEAGGVAGVIVCGASADPYGWKALRGAMGSAFRVPIVREGKAEEVMGRLQGAGVRVLATAQRQGAFYERALTGACAIVLGGEGPGLSPELIAAADGVVSIPMQPPVESLNVAVSAAVIIYEARRQRAQVHEQQRITVRG